MLPIHVDVRGSKISIHFIAFKDLCAPSYVSGPLMITILHHETIYIFLTLNHNIGQDPPHQNKQTMSILSVLSVERHFAYYRSTFWEEQPLVHGFFVWPILFNLIVLLSYTAVLYPRPLWVDAHVPYFLTRYLVLNYSFVATSFYSVYYVALDPRAGFLASALVMCCWIGANAFSQFVPWEIGWKVRT